MARMARVVVPGVPHHVTQRGNRRQKVFFCNSDYRLYFKLLGEYCNKANVEIWAYCLMPNHVHLVMVPGDVKGLHRSLAETHRRYTSIINSREEWSGYLWQGRFASFPMDEMYLYSAVRYVEMNPVRAGLCEDAREWKWSSARAHSAGCDDGLVKVEPMLSRVTRWDDYLQLGELKSHQEDIRKHCGTGRPLGTMNFIQQMEERTGRLLRPRKRGRKPLDRTVSANK